MRYDTCCVADFYCYNKYPNHSSDIGQHDAKIINISGNNQWKYKTKRQNDNYTHFNNRADISVQKRRVTDTLRVLKTAPDRTINMRRIISIIIDPTSTCSCTCIMFKWRISVKQYKNKTKFDVLWYYASTYRPVQSFHHFVPILYQIYYRKIRSVRIGSTYWKIIYWEPV